LPTAVPHLRNQAIRSPASQRKSSSWLFRSLQKLPSGLHHVASLAKVPCKTITGSIVPSSHVHIRPLGTGTDPEKRAKGVLIVRSGSRNEPATAGARCARGRSQWHRRSDQASGITLAATSRVSRLFRGRTYGLDAPAPKFRILKIHRAETGAEIRALWCEMSEILRQRPGPLAAKRCRLSAGQKAATFGWMSVGRLVTPVVCGRSWLRLSNSNPMRSWSKRPRKLPRSCGKKRRVRTRGGRLVGRRAGLGSPAASGPNSWRSMFADLTLARRDAPT
jgi:hypothetical protein